MVAVLERLKESGLPQTINFISKAPMLGRIVMV